MKIHKILVADDEPNIVTLVTATLALDQTYDVIVAHNGIEAVKLARQVKPALMLLDIRMPVKDGFMVCKELKNDPETADIKIVILSALAQEHDKKLAAKAGADKYLTKPFRPAQLLETIESLLRE